MDGMCLSDRTVLITGAGSGIGRTTAIRCAALGAHVVVTDIDLSSAEETATMVTDAGGAADVHQLDVRDYDAVAAVIHAVEDTSGLNVVVNNAGVTQTQTFSEMTPAARDDLIAVHLSGVWNGCHAAMPIFREQGGGAIVNVSSVGALHGFPDAVTYACCNAGILNLTKSLAGAFGGDGVRVNAVLPGRIRTPLLTEKLGSDTETRELEAAHALKRFGESEEVADCIAFLASESASFVTGHGLVVDGGSTLRT